MTTLPPLPRVLNKKEADITPDVFKWFRENYPYTVALEVKIKGGRMKPHQKVALDEVQRGVFSFKFPDMGRRNPFDGVVLHDAEAFVVTCDGRKCEAVRIDGEKSFFFKI